MVFAVREAIASETPLFSKKEEGFPFSAVMIFLASVFFVMEAESNPIGQGILLPIMVFDT